MDFVELNWVAVGKYVLGKQFLHHLKVIDDIDLDAGPDLDEGGLVFDYIRGKCPVIKATLHGQPG